MRDPQIFNAYHLINTGQSRPHVSFGEGWRPARGEGFNSLRYRFRCAWLVLTGRADALIWPGQER